MTKLKKIAKFNTQDEERKFWAKADSSDYIDWGKSKKEIFANFNTSRKYVFYLYLEIGN